MQEKLDKIDEFFENLTVEEFEDIAIRVGVKVNNDDILEPIKVWCEQCEGKGYYSVADYHYDGSPNNDIELECETCDGDGYTILIIQ